jgi:hypothetical protein
MRSKRAGEGRLRVPNVDRVSPCWRGGLVLVSDVDRVSPCWRGGLVWRRADDLLIGEGSPNFSLGSRR